MNEMLLINPRRRRKGASARTRNRFGQFVSRKTRRRSPTKAAAPKRRRRRNPIATAVNPRKRRRRNPVMAVNPRKRRRRAASYAVRSRRVRRRLSNPISLSPRGIVNMLVPAGIGGAGALALDIGMSYVPLPAFLQTPWGKNAARVAGALALGYGARFVTSRSNANTVMVGALTVTAYNIIRDLAAQFFPTLGLSGINSYDYSDLRVGAYMNNQPLGFLNPAPMVTGENGGNMGAYMRTTLDNVNAGQLSGGADL